MHGPIWIFLGQPNTVLAEGGAQLRGAAAGQPDGPAEPLVHGARDGVPRGARDRLRGEVRLAVGGEFWGCFLCVARLYSVDVIKCLEEELISR